MAVKMETSKSPFDNIYPLLLLTSLLLVLPPMASSSPSLDIVIQCLESHSNPTYPVTDLIFTPNNSSYIPVLDSYIRNLRFKSASTPKPFLIITPTHVSHIQAAILCSKEHGLQMRIRSGGHDYDGLSYVSDQEQPFIILDMFNMKDISVDAEKKIAWVQSGATLGELFYEISLKSKVLGFPAGVCPTVGVGGHFSGGGYGNMMRKYGLSTDNVIDAQIVDVNGSLLDGASMGEDLFWAIRGGGGASFGVIVSWKIELVQVPEVVTVFRIEKTLEQGATDIVHRWQFVADKVDPGLFIRVVVMPVVKKEFRTVKAKFNALFLGNADELVDVMNEGFAEFGLKREDCIEMSWIESVLFWYNYEIGTSLNVLLDREPGKISNFLKKKSDYVQEPISVSNLEGVWKMMMELGKPVMTFNPYGGRMAEIPDTETAFPHRTGNIFKIQYSINWKDEGNEAEERSLGLIRKLYDYMTPYVSKSPRAAYLNYRDVDIGVNGKNGEAAYSEAKVWGEKYFMGNYDRLVNIKTMVDPTNFFRYEQSIPPHSISQESNSAKGSYILYE